VSITEPEFLRFSEQERPGTATADSNLAAAVTWIRYDLERRSLNNGHSHFVELGGYIAFHSSTSGEDPVFDLSDTTPERCRLDGTSAQYANDSRTETCSGTVQSAIRTSQRFALTISQVRECDALWPKHRPRSLRSGFRGEAAPRHFSSPQMSGRRDLTFGATAKHNRPVNSTDGDPLL
jgi:hypothetical protein